MRCFPDGTVPSRTLLVCRSFNNESSMVHAVSVMLLDNWNLADSDSVLAIAHRGRGVHYTVSSTPQSRSPVHYMVHCSQLLLESDWPMPECSESLGLLFGGPKTELNHSLYAAVWDTTNSIQFPNVELSSRVDVWSKGIRLPFIHLN